mmetsp:Transcript_95628/g.276296  ORF Transcript_95628/g.276296 Transcript_95628/m.276296 type:complete len:233 (-) Transcript_95628:75-773(-)
MSHWNADLPQRWRMPRRSDRSTPSICSPVRVISTNGTKVTGTKNRKPTTRGAATPDSRTASLNLARGSDNVFVANNTPAGAAAAASARTARLISNWSGTASMMISTPRAASLIEGQNRTRRGASPGKGIQGPSSLVPCIAASRSNPCSSHDCKTENTCRLMWSSASSRDSLANPLSKTVTSEPNNNISAKMCWPRKPAPMTQTRGGIDTPSAAVSKLACASASVDDGSIAGG